jgi:Kef-type K+ transport system membrane component KefB
MAVALALAGAALVMIVAAVLSVLGRRLRQPAVIAEIAAGICLGPSLLGLAPGHLPARLFPTDVRPLLSSMAEVGIVVFMFLVGWDLDVSVMRGRRGLIGTVALSAMALPFACGVGLATWLYSGHQTVAGHHVGHTAFLLFVGVAMSITAFPVLARIIIEHRLGGTEVGVVALASAAAGDLLAWGLLALVTAVAAAEGPDGLTRVLVSSAVYLAVMFVLVRPVLARAVAWLGSDRRDPAMPMTLIGAGIFLSAYLTQWAGLDAIFGAFVFGAVMPRGATGLLRTRVAEPMDHVKVLLMPIFFIITGLSIDVRKLGGSGLAELAVIIVVACACKFLGAGLPARLFGMSWRDSGTLGLLMNTRGLTELIILNVGLTLGVLDTRMFTMMVLMALVTTGMAGPLVPRLPDLRAEDALRPVRAALPGR